MHVVFGRMRRAPLVLPTLSEALTHSSIETRDGLSLILDNARGDGYPAPDFTPPGHYSRLVDRSLKLSTEAYLAAEARDYERARELLAASEAVEKRLQVAHREWLLALGVSWYVPTMDRLRGDR